MRLGSSAAPNNLTILCKKWLVFVFPASLCAILTEIFITFRNAASQGLSSQIRDPRSQISDPIPQIRITDPDRFNKKGGVDGGRQGRTWSSNKRHIKGLTSSFYEVFFFGGN